MILNGVLSLLAFFLASLLYVKPNLGFKCFSFVVFTLPLSFLFDIQFSTISFYRVFIFFQLLFILFVFFYYKKNFWETEIFLYITFLVLYLISFMLSSFQSVIVLIKDFLIIQVFIFTIFTAKYLSSKILINISLIEKFVIYGVIIDVFCLLLIFFFDIKPSGIRGEFMERTGFIRYSDIATLTLFAFSSFLYYRTPANFAGKWLFVILIISIMSFDRVFLFWFVVTLIHYITRIHKVRFYKVVIYFITVLFASFGILNFFESLTVNAELANRVLELSTLENIYHALYFRFVEPATQGGYLFTIRTFLVGEGPGFQFFIPWFEYRDLDPYQISSDSFFFANFIKYGLIGCSLLFILIFKEFGAQLKSSQLWLVPYFIVQNAIVIDAFLLLLFCFICLRPSLYLNEK